MIQPIQPIIKIDNTIHMVGISQTHILTYPNVTNLGYLKFQ